MNQNPPSNPSFPGHTPSDPNQETQLRPSWHSGETPQQPQYQQFPQQPYVQQPYPQVYQQPFPYAAQGPKAPRPKWLLPTIIGGAALLLVIVLVGVIAVVSSSGGDGKSDSPGGAVKAYFAALQAGDAKKALSFGKEAPATTDLLTDDVLKNQTRIAPIKDLKIVSETAGYIGQVHLTVTIGEVAYDEQISLDKVGDQWKLKTAAVQIKPYFSYDADKQNLTILGKDLPASGVVYAFPGALDLGSKSKNLTVQKDTTISGNTGQASVKGLSGYGGGNVYVRFGLSDSAKTAARTQIAAAYSACAASKDRAPSGCPQSDFTGENGTYTWTAPNAQDIQFDDAVRNGEASFTDRRPWAFTATSRDGGPVSGTDTGFVYGKVTVTADAVAVSLR